MKLYLELDIEEGPHAVANALTHLAGAIVQREKEHGDSLERRAIADNTYMGISPAIVDIDVR